MAARGFRDSSLREFALANSWQSKQNKCASAQPNLARFVVQKIGIKGRSSASADFLLEADKRGSPPKSEKRQLLARRGSEVGGAALLRKESNENSGNGIAESIRDSSPLAQNDKIKKAHNNKVGGKVAESTLDSADLQNLQDRLPREQSSLAMTDFSGLPRRFCESARNDESLLDSAKFN